MATAQSRPERVVIGGTIEIPRILNGLWQLAGGHDKDVSVTSAAQAMDALTNAGLDGFDMADHYGDAEVVIGTYNKTNKQKASAHPIAASTKWCPAEDGITTFANAEAAIDRALHRMQQTQIALLQYHIWDYSDPTYLHNLTHLRTLQQQGKIALLGLTNTDAAHLELLLHSGFPIATNQVSISVLDRRVTRGRMASVCAEHNVGILAYGTLLGGFLSERWLGFPEPTDMDALNWSLRKYLRFIRAAGGWAAFQRVLAAVAAVAARHGVSIAAVAIRWVLDIPVVRAVIVGARLSATSERYVAANLQAFTFMLDEGDRAEIWAAQEGLVDLPGDCGDEYRRAPFLTAAGDLSHHIKETDQKSSIEEAIANGKRVEFGTRSKWESIAGYSRAVRTGDTIRVSGTTASPPPGLEAGMKVVGGRHARSQTVAVLDIIERSLKALGGTMSDVVRTRILVPRAEDVEGISRAHGWAFNSAKVRPANMLTLGGLVGDEFLVEIEAEAVVGSEEVVTVL